MQRAVHARCKDSPYAQLRDRHEARQQELRTAQDDLTSLQRDLDLVRDERDNALL